MLMLMTESLRSCQLARMEVLGGLLKSQRLVVCAFDARVELVVSGGDLAVVSEQLFKVLGAEDVDLGEKQLALDKSGGAVVQDGPDRDQVLELASSLLNDAVLASQDDGHSGQVINLGVADDERVNVESSGGKNTRQTRQHTRLVLDQAVENMPLGRRHRRRGRLVQNVGYGRLR